MRTCLAQACAAFFAVAAPALAEDWPSHPVSIVNTFAPGGAASFEGRFAATSG
jgi:tripartite-type tricarboxylate transporter receptor subunit TctC